MVQEDITPQDAVPEVSPQPAKTNLSSTPANSNEDANSTQSIYDNKQETNPAISTAITQESKENIFQNKVLKMRAAGFSEQEVNDWTAQQGGKMLAAGFDQQEVNDYIGNKLPDMSDIQKMVQDNLTKQAVDNEGKSRPLSLEEAIKHGFQTSVIGLMTRQELPDQEFTGNEPWYARAASTTAQVVGDIPTMIAGATVGAAGGAETGPGAAITGMGGAFALPSALRAVYIDSIKKGDFNNFSEFMERALPVAVETAKSYITGIGTGAVGIAAAPLGIGAKIGSESVTMTGVSSVLNGKAPTKQDFIDNSIVMFGMHGAVKGAEYLQNVYKDTGVTPVRVMEDAKKNPEIAKDIEDGVTPKAYEVFKEKGTTDTVSLDEAENKLNQQEKISTQSEFGDNYIPPEKTSYSKEGETVSMNPLNQILNPTNISKSSQEMATALRQGKGPAAQSTAIIQDSLQKYTKDIGKLNDTDRLKFIDYMENRSSGAEIPDKNLQPVADVIKDIYSKMADKVKEVFPDVGLRKDYFTHQYADEAKAKQFFDDWVAKQGSERNLRERAFPTLKEAIDAGLKPKTTNPIETVMRYVTNMNNLIAAHEGLNLAIEGGLADYFKKGQQPSGWIPMKGNLSKKGGKVLYAPEDAARIYNNDVSKGAIGPAGDILDNIQRGNNFISKLVLGLSGYHLTATTMASMASDVARAINSGVLGEGLKDIKSAVTPLKNTLQGEKFIGAYLGREQLSPELQQALDLAVQNNTINIKQQDYWKAGPAKDYVDAFKAGTIVSEFKEAGKTIAEKPLTGTVKVVANEIGRTMDTISKPLFDYYIPRIKISANIQELHSWLERHPDATSEQQNRAAQDIGNSIDNRFGEMMRDNLFWHQITRQTLQTALLSYSWVTGGARLVKGVPDIGMTILGKKELSSNAKYLFGMAATYVVANGVRTYIGTGHLPNSWKDFLYPRTGGITVQGKPEREILPSHIGQYTHYLHDGIGHLGDEINPGLKLLYHLTSNQDFRGLPITNANNSWFSEQRWSDYIKYVLHEETPIGLKTFLQGNKKGSKISNFEKVIGAAPAPRFITDSEGVHKIEAAVNDKQYKKKVRSDARLKAQLEE